MIKIGIFDRYLSTLGGGERYSCKMAEVLSKNNNYKVDLITDLYSDLSEVSERLNLDLSETELRIPVSYTHLILLTSRALKCTGMKMRQKESGLTKITLIYLIHLSLIHI